MGSGKTFVAHRSSQFASVLLLQLNKMPHRKTGAQLRIFFTGLWLFFWIAGAAQIRIISWNLQNFGKSKSDQQINYVATRIKDADLVAIVEVVSGNGGAQGVARVADALNRMGSSWDYT